MNFLAHCVLADHAAKHWQVDPQTRQGLLAGAVIADFIKGPVNPTWPQSLQAGVRLHRRVDAFSNTQQAIKITCERFPARYRRYAPIFVDLLADYFLSLSWDNWHNEPRTTFSIQCYAALTTYKNFLPAHGKRFLHYAQQQDLFANYHQWEHIQLGLSSVLRRLDKENWLAEVNEYAKSLQISGQSDFDLYYAELEQQLPSWRELLR